MEKINWHEKLGRGNKYTWQELRKKICPTQSSTADYIIGDLIASGLLEEKVNRIFQVKI
jgi:hypothetical protein